MTDKPTREPWEDGCLFQHGVVCKDETPDCAHCGWYPREAQRRREQIRAKRKGVKKA